MMLRKLGVFFIVLSMFNIIYSPIKITGFALAEIENEVLLNSLMAMIFLIIGIALFLFNKFNPDEGEDISSRARIKEKKPLTNIEGILYEEHALERMELKKVMPSLVRDAIENGTIYNLTHVYEPDKTTGATRAYIMKEIGETSGRGGIGERIIKINPGKRNWRHLLVLTNKDDVVKTVELSTDAQLKKFYENYTRKSKSP